MITMNYKCFFFRRKTGSVAAWLLTAFVLDHLIFPCQSQPAFSFIRRYDISY